jgi:hypothetical protein
VKRARLWILAAVATVLALPAPARAQEEDLGAVADTVFDPTQTFPANYRTVFDRDHSRTNWTQTLTYFRSTPRYAFNGSGNVTTQDLLAIRNKTTLGSFTGRLDSRLTRRWVVSMDGRFNMSSSVDPRSKNDNRNSKIQLFTQYTLNPMKTMSLFGSLYTEFQRDQTGREQTIVLPADTLITEGEVDTLRAQRDSSYTTARQDGLAGRLTWTIRPGLDLYSTASASRRSPSQRNRFRDFVHPLNGSGGGYFSDSVQVLSEGSDNSAFLSRLNYSGIPRSKMSVTFQNSAVDQSRFDQELRGLETMAFDRTSATGHLDYGPRLGLYLTVDGSLARAQNVFARRRTSNSLVNSRQLLSSLSYNNPGTMASVTFQMSRANTERQLSQSDLVLDRSLAGLFRRTVSSRLVLDGSARINLRSAQFSDPRTDQDLLQTGGNVGGGYLLTRACSTTVHFSVSRSRTVSIDSRASGSNNVQTIYQMNATVLFVPMPNFAIRQTYLLGADYKIYDFSESQNFLNRTRRIETDFADTLFPFAFLRMTHSYLFRDNGNYSRFTPDAERAYRVALETSEQTLKVSVGVKVAPGVTFLATQGLFHQRNRNFAISSPSTLRNRFSLDAGIDVNRSLPGGAQIVGALRHIGGYDERTTPQTRPNEEGYWIAGVTFLKDF